MARVGVAPITVASVRPMPTTIMNVERCPSNIISSPTVLSYNSNRRNSSNFWRNCCAPCCCCFYSSSSSIPNNRMMSSTCIHVDFMRRASGVLKLLEAILGIICQFLLLEYGSPYANRLGESYTEFLISVSYCLISTVLLLACYLLSKNTYILVRSSIYEVAFNIVACILYFSSSSYLAYALITKLYPDYVRIPFFQVYPALTAAYILGFTAGLMHGVDGVLAYRGMQNGR